MVSILLLPITLFGEELLLSAQKVSFLLAAFVVVMPRVPIPHPHNSHLHNKQEEEPAVERSQRMPTLLRFVFQRLSFRSAPMPINENLSYKPTGKSTTYIIS